MKDKASNLENILRPTTFIEAPRLKRRLGIKLTFASETYQHTGSFKFRAAYNVAAQVEQETLITSSSGNFGQALALACDLLGKQAIIVMPDTSARVKIDAVAEFGGQVELVDVTVKSRAEKVAELSAKYPDAFVASAYDDPFVIAGNATLGTELSNKGFDVIVVPVGGGGLSAGVVKGTGAATNNDITVVGAEPLLGNDAARSLREGYIVRNETEPMTIADGARTVSLGELNWSILKVGIERIVEVPEDRIEEAVRLLFSLANVKAEPTGALSLGALLTCPEIFRDRSVCCVISGGNVDPLVYQKILAG